MTTVLAVVSDLHTNSTIGLCPARQFQLDDGGYYKPSKAQRWLWRNWIDYIGKVEATARKYDARILTVFNGDLFDGDHHGTYQIITRNPSTMQRLAWETTKPLVDISDAVYVVRGTPAHVGQSGNLEEEYAEDLTNAVHDEENGRASFDHLLLKAEGTLFDVAHHRAGGRLPWTRANVANRMAIEMILSYSDEPRRRPDIVIRAHKHKFIDSGRNYPVRVIGCPAWQLATGYVRTQLDTIHLSDIGGLIFTVTGGLYTFEEMLYRPDRPQVVMA